MPIAHKRSPAVVAARTAAKAQRDAAKTRLPNLDAYLLINNPNSTQQRDQITLLTRAALETVQGVIGAG